MFNADATHKSFHVPRASTVRYFIDNIIEIESAKDVLLATDANALWAGSGPCLAKIHAARKRTPEHVNPDSLFEHRHIAMYGL